MEVLCCEIYCLCLILQLATPFACIIRTTIVQDTHFMSLLCARTELNCLQMFCICLSTDCLIVGYLPLLLGDLGRLRRVALMSASSMSVLPSTKVFLI